MWADESGPGASKDDQLKGTPGSGQPCMSPVLQQLGADGQLLNWRPQR